ncbi:MAG: GPP34 family phosphoprotein [Deltaproteobacteria bacterium]|nr:MAG: GPP34 family phosphoprotein [Deltaproteobacteria bacterium]
MLTLAHEFLLLALDDQRGTSLAQDAFVLQGGVSAAFLAEMMFRDRLVPVQANKFQLAEGPLSEGVLGEVEETLVGRKPGSLDKCMGWLRGFFGNRDLEGWLKADLVTRGVLDQTPDRFLFLTWRTRFPAVDMATENALIARLREHLATAGHDEPPCRDDALISILRASKMLGTVWSEDEVETLRPQLLERTRRAPIGKVAKTYGDQLRMAATMAST